MSVFGDAWRAVKKLKARDFLSAAAAVARFLRRNRKGGGKNNESDKLDR